MPKKVYHLHLTSEQRQMLVELISAGKGPARTLSHARILLKADSGPEGPCWGDAAIAEAVEVSPATVGKVRQRFFEAKATQANRDDDQGRGQEGLEALKEARKSCTGVSPHVSTRAALMEGKRLIL